MGASGGDSAGGGGSGVPDTIRPPKVRRKERFQESLKNFKTPAQLIIGGVKKIGEAAKKSNLKRRKSFIKKQGLTDDDIRMDDAYLSSKEGLRELRKQGYTTASDNIGDGGSSGRDDNQTTEATAKAPLLATSPAMNTGEVDEVITETASDKSKPTEEERIIAAKRRNKTRTRLAQKEDELTLGKKVLLST